ncbi:MAG: dioxygenase [marine bacterium B5-7]|nr:MAG: dioxygenase [marine bacterium B5-7]
MDWQIGPADSWERLGAWLTNFSTELPARPVGILLISAHWEEAELTVQGGAQPDLLFDYHGFPEHTYQLEYPACGSPDIAHECHTLLQQQGIECQVSTDRPYDHGMFVPMKLMFPEADIPVVQLSLRQDLDAGFHIRAGAALASLRDKGVLVVGSGLSYHNLLNFIQQRDSRSSQLFDDWLNALCELDVPDRQTQLEAWQTAPAARAAHPREEHLLPLMVAAGAAGNDSMHRVFTDTIHRHHISAFRFD